MYSCEDFGSFHEGSDQLFWRSGRVLQQNGARPNFAQINFCDVTHLDAESDDELPELVPEVEDPDESEPEPLSDPEELASFFSVFFFAI